MLVDQLKRITCGKHSESPLISSWFRTALSWAVSQRVVLRYHTARCVIAQKSAVLIYFATEFWYHAQFVLLTLTLAHTEPSYLTMIRNQRQRKKASSDNPVITATNRKM